MRIVVFTLFFLLSCSPKNKTHKPVVNVEIDVPNSDFNGISFAQVQPVFQNLCSRCHPSRRAPNWLVYSEAIVYVKNGLLKQNVVDSNAMPLVGSPEATLITDQDRKLISDWIESGAKEFSSDEANPNSSDLNGTNQQPTEILQTTPDQTPIFAQSCIGCHDSHGNQYNFKTGTPNIAGQNSDYINHQLMNYKWYRRIDPNHQMNQMAALLTDQEIVQISDYFSQIFFEKNNIDLDNVEFNLKFESGKSIAENSCNYCHMISEKNYTSNSGLIPNLKGQSQLYLTRQLIFYQNGMRDNNLMKSLVQNLSHKDIESISIYYSNF